MSFNVLVPLGPYISVPMAAMILGVSTRTIERYAYDPKALEGELDPKRHLFRKIKTGRRVSIFTEDVISTREFECTRVIIEDSRELPPKKPSRRNSIDAAKRLQSKFEN